MRRSKRRLALGALLGALSLIFVSLFLFFFHLCDGLRQKKRLLPIYKELIDKVLLCLSPRGWLIFAIMLNPIQHC